MPAKLDQDSTPGIKLLRLFNELMLKGGKHFQSDLAKKFECSPQTIIRMIGEIEAVIGASLETGLENRRRWYQIKSIKRSRLGLDYEEVRYLSICRDLGSTILPEQILNRVDDTIFSLSMLMSDQGYANRDTAQKQQFSFFSKGKIDYTPHFKTIEQLLQAADNQQICLVTYKAVGKAESREHRFVPNRMVSMSGAIYILGVTLTEDFKDIRHLNSLAVHRIQDVTLLDRKFVCDFPESSPEAFGLPWHEPRAFRIHFRPGNASDYVRERIWAEEQRIEEQADGSIVLELTTCSEPELMAWVRSFGDEIVCLES